MNAPTIIILIIILIIGFVFFIRSKILRLISTTLRTSFFILIIAALIALFIPQIFNTAADLTFHVSGNYEKIQDLDKNFPLNNLADLPQNIIDLITGGNQIDKTETKFFEKNIYPSLVESLGFFYRILTLIISIVGLIGIIYVSYAASSVTDTENLKIRYEQLEKRVKELETQISTSKDTIN